MNYFYSAEREDEDPRTQIARRLQQQRCLVCGARNLVNHQTSYFCAAHIGDYRYCSLCGILRTTADHGKDSRCQKCASHKALAYYHANSDKTIYRIRLRQIAQRQFTRGDQIFAHMRRRIALAALVSQTPGWSWPRRAAVFGGNPTQLAYQWRRQNSTDLRDVDATDHARAAYWQVAA
jgi:hypothetical protein